MNYLDVILIILLGFSAIRGFRKGLILELSTFVALVLGVWAGFYFADFISGLMEDAFDYHGKAINIISFVILFISVIILVKILAGIIEKAVEVMALGLMNKTTGAFFSVLKTLFILSVMFYFLNRLDTEHQMIGDESRKASGLFSFTESIAPAMMPKMKEFSAHIQQMPGSKAEPKEETNK